MLPNPITKKLFIKPGCNLLIVNAPANYTEILGPLPEHATLELAASGTYDAILLFVIDKSELNRELLVLLQHLRADSIFWIVYPKKSSGIKSDLEMMGSWDQLTTNGYNSVAAAAINDTWTAIWFRPADQIKRSDGSNSKIPESDFSNYINLTNRMISLPEDLQAGLEKYPEAQAFFEQLSFTNQKEYVLWVLCSKQEKTRTERIAKTVAKLSDRKKNPADK